MDPGLREGKDRQQSGEPLPVHPPLPATPGARAVVEGDAVVGVVAAPHLAEPAMPCRQRQLPALRRCWAQSSFLAPASAKTSFARSTPWDSMRSVFSLMVYLILGDGIPWLSVNFGSRVTRLCSSGKS